MSGKELDIYDEDLRKYYDLLNEVERQKKGKRCYEIQSIKE